MGKTVNMLREALSMRANAEQLPILICGANFAHCNILAQEFIRLAGESGAIISFPKRRVVALDDTDEYEFRSFSAGVERLRGKEYSHVFIDHYALEMEG
jgi:hypothetical protein